MEEEGTKKEPPKRRRGKENRRFGKKKGQVYKETTRIEKGEGSRGGWALEKRISAGGFKIVGEGI